MAQIPKILGTDSLRNAFPKLNMMVDTVNQFKKELDDMVIKGDSSPAIAHALADTPYNTLREKHQAIDAQLAQVPTKADLERIGSASPKGTYATVTALQAAFPNGTTGVYLVSADGKWYYWNGTAWTAGGVYQAAGLNNGSVTIEKLSPQLQSLFIVEGSVWS